jgi:hypothetical protein
MPVTFPRRTTSTVTQIVVSALPAWVPAPGEYATVSLLTASATAGIDPCPGSNCPYSFSEGQAAIWRDWNGGAYNPNWGAYGSIILHGGGHWGYAGNEVLRYDIASRAWTRLNNPSNYGWNKDGWVPFVEAPGAVVNSYGGFPDGAPNPIHTYNNMEYFPSAAGGGTLGSIVFMHRYNSNSNVTDFRFWRFDLATLSWTNGPTAIKASAGQNRCALVYDANRQGVWKLDYAEYSATSQGLSFHSFLTGNQYAVNANSGNSFQIGAGSGNLHAMMTYHPGRDFLLLWSKVSGVRNLVCVDLSGFTPGVTAFAPAHNITQSGTPHPNIMSVDAPERLEYCSHDGAFWAINWPTNARLYKLAPPAGALTGTWTWTNELLTPKAGTLSLAFDTTRTADNQLFSRFRYVPALKSFIWTDRQDMHVQMGRPAAFT